MLLPAQCEVQYIARLQVPAQSQLQYIGRLCQQSPDLSRTYLAHHELESVLTIISILIHLLNVDCSPLGDVEGDVLLRGGSRDAAAAVQLGCARQDLHIQTTCNQTDVQTDRQMDGWTDGHTDT